MEDAIIGISIYSVIVIICYFTMKVCYKQSKSQILLQAYKMEAKKMPMGIIVLISCMFMLFNFYITTPNAVLGSDRTNYYASFHGDHPLGSMGLSIIFDVIHIFSNNMTVVFCVITFVCIFLTFLSYRKFKYATPEAMLLLLLTNYVLGTFVNLKQCFANAFACMFFAILLGAEKKDKIKCIPLMILAACFHPAGYILIPIYFMLREKKRSGSIIFWLMALVLVFLFFEPTMVWAAKVLKPVVPGLSSKIASYFLVEGSGNEGVSLAFLRGIPFYYIFALGIVKRNQLRSKIQNFDNYLLICGVGAILFLASIYSYWMHRFIVIFYLPIFVFFCQIMNKTDCPEMRLMHSLLVYGSTSFFLYREIFLIYYLWGGF